MKTIVCDKCGHDVPFEPKSRTEGDFEILFLKCPSCEEEYIASVTDTSLRQEVERYHRMANTIANMKVTERFIRSAQKLHARNVQRSRTLRESYINQH